MTIELHLADPRWADVFDGVSDELATALGHSSSIEHVGSTAVPDLAAKPIIDVLVGLPDHAAMHDAIGMSAKLGFELGEMGSPKSNNAFLYRPAHRGGMPVNLHLTIIGSDQWDNLIQFRTALRDDPTLRSSYEDLKHRLIVAANGDLEAYTMGKTQFISEVLGMSDD